MNYYEILQVDKKASQEVIEKAFKVLAKKYHPDAQPEEKKEWAEQQFKELNNAYEVLSNIEKRAEYDNTLIDDTISLELMQNMKEFQEELIEKNKHLSNLVNQLEYKLQLYENRQNYVGYKTYIPPQRQYQNTTSYENTQPQKREKNHTLKSFISFLLTIFIIIVVFTALWFIPFTHNFFVGLYENNPIIKGIVDLFI